MNYTHYDLGGLGKGKVVEVVLQGNTANVFLMDSENLSKYTQGKPFQALGGLMTFSPIRMQTIEAAHWHIVIDLPQGKGKVKTSYQITSTKLPNISTRLAPFKITDAQKRALIDKAASEKTEKKPAAEPVAAKTPEQISCPKCGILTLPGKFCTDCGAPMEKCCPGCSIINPIASKFCFECGYKL